MALEFQGKALPLDRESVAIIVDRLNVGVAELWAILEVETSGCGFLMDRRPLILYERHIFSRLSNQRFDTAHPEISNPARGGYGAGGTHQYERLALALSLDRKAALRSASWGIGQVMGFNAENAGYADEEAMVTDMAVSEHQQLLALVGEITQNRLDSALRRHDWATFARGYNGPAYAENSYDTRLAAAYQKFSRGPLPDLVVRAAQLYLTYLGYHPGPVDGWMGKHTRSALAQFQEAHGIAITSEIDEDQLSALKQEVEELSA